MTKKKTEKEDFDYLKVLEDMELISFLKEGIIRHIQTKGLEIKSEKELKEILKEFGGE